MASDCGSFSVFASLSYSKRFFSPIIGDSMKWKLIAATPRLIIKQARMNVIEPTAKEWVKDMSISRFVLRNSDRGKWNKYIP